MKTLPVGRGGVCGAGGSAGGPSRTEVTSHSAGTGDWLGTRTTCRSQPSCPGLSVRALLGSRPAAGPAGCSLFSPHDPPSTSFPAQGDAVLTPRCAGSQQCRGSDHPQHRLPKVRRHSPCDRASVRWSGQVEPHLDQVQVDSCGLMSSQAKGRGLLE